MGYEEFYEYNDTYTVLFYSDKACTQRITTSNPRYIRIRVERKYCDGYNEPVSRQSYYRDILIPEGRYSYNLGTEYNNTEHYTNGNNYYINTTAYYFE